MPLICEDLAKYGVILVPPSAPEYFRLLADIEHRLQTRPKVYPPLFENELSLIAEHDDKSAILLNQAPQSIASLAFIWSCPIRNGQIRPQSFLPGTNTCALLPFSLSDHGKKYHNYWRAIFAGSKRLMRADGSNLGDNSDVRPPAADELPAQGSGYIRWGGVSSVDDLRPLKLTLDGVFFVDGGFAGQNRLGSWEHTVFAAEAYLAWGARPASPSNLPNASGFVSSATRTDGSNGQRPAYQA